MRRILLALLLFPAVLATTGETNLFADQMLSNGDFSTPGTPPDPFAAWTTNLGAPPKDGGEFALFEEDPDSATVLEQAFRLDDGALTLSFDLLFETTVTDVPAIPPDSFQATLYVAGLDPFPTPLDPPGLPAFYSVDASGFITFDSNYVTVLSLADGWIRVTLDVSSISGEDVLLEFVLNGFDDGRTTTAAVDNVALTTAGVVVPEPSALLAALSALACLGTRQVLVRRRARPAA